MPGSSHEPAFVVTLVTSRVVRSRGLSDYPHFCDTREAPLCKRGWSLGDPCCCITEVDSISLSPADEYSFNCCGPNQHGALVVSTGSWQAVSPTRTVRGVAFRPGTRGLTRVTGVARQTQPTPSERWNPQLKTKQSKTSTGISFRGIAHGNRGGTKY